VELIADERGINVAASRAIRADLNHTDQPGPQIMERLQYRTVPTGKAQDESPEKNGRNPAGPAGDWEALYPSQSQPQAGAEDRRGVEPSPEAQSDGHLMLAELEQRLQQERAAAAHAVAAAREQGRSEALQAIEQQVNAEQKKFQAQIVQSLEQFRLERQSYFHAVEGEVVRLALAIAARVLHREAHLDPLLLAGAIRVALEKLGDSSRVVMRVPPPEVDRWKEFFRVAANLRIQPGILEDPSLSAGECLLGTELGTIELGVRAQLEEIEKGFFDLLDRRPVDAIANGVPAGRDLT
jgi:flagellar assembly protein FliH